MTTDKPPFEFITSVRKSELKSYLDGSEDDDVLSHIKTDEPIPDFIRSDVIAIVRQRADQSKFVIDRIVRFEDFGANDVSAGRVTLMVHEED